MKPRGSSLAADWLHRQDSFTQETFGRSRSLCAIQDECVACGCQTTSADTNGLCPRCSAQRMPDYCEIVLFRPLRRVK